jgi:uncharacterized protein (DUF433 family)
MDFENKLQINNGIYTMPDISKILRIPYYKVNKWVNCYWDERLGSLFENKYSWTVENTKAVSFHTLIEFYVLYLLGEAGVSTRNVLNAHIELSKDFNTPFPFAQRSILQGMNTDGRKVFFENKDGIIELDGKKQFKIEFIKTYFKNIDFDSDLLATRFWPLGKERNIIVDPQRQFGHPVIGSTNIYPETFYNLYKAGEPIEFIAFTYEVDSKLVKDAIEYCQAA